MGKRALRRCLFCRLYFKSSSPAERICSPCRKKHKSRLKAAEGMVIIPTTADMERHMSSIERFGHVESRREELKKKADKFIEDENEIDFDDSEIYEEIKEEIEEFDYEDVKPPKPKKAPKETKKQQVSKVNMKKDTISKYEWFEF